MESYEEMPWIYEDDNSYGERRHNHYANVIREEKEDLQRRYSYSKRILLLGGGLLFMLLLTIVQCATIVRKRIESKRKVNKAYDNHYYENGFRQYYVNNDRKDEPKYQSQSKSINTEISSLDDDFRDVLSSKDVERIAILGERNSKVSEIASHLVRCFPEIEVTTSFSRLGTWFQDRSLEFSKNPTLVICAFLNIYDWIYLMRQNPLHAPNHENMDWRTFVTSPWIMNRSQSDLIFETKGKLCQWGFNYSEVIPCLLSSKFQKDPVYELKRDGSGKPFKNILRLRSAKIRNFIATKKYKNVHGHLTVKYENLVQNNGFKNLVELITSEIGMPSHCDLSKISLSMPLESNAMHDKNYVDWINKEADWIAEKKIKYKMDEMFQFPEPKIFRQQGNKTKTEKSSWSKDSSITSTLLIESKEAQTDPTPISLSPSQEPAPISLNRDVKPAFNSKAKKFSGLQPSHLKSTNWHRNMKPPLSYKKGKSAKITRKKKSP